MTAGLIAIHQLRWLLGACFCFTLARHGGRVGQGVALLLGGAAALMMIGEGFAPAERLEYLFLSLLAVAFLIPLRRPVWQYALAGVVASALAVGIVGVVGQREFAALVDVVPFRSLSARLDYEKNNAAYSLGHEQRLRVESADALDALDASYRENDSTWEYDYPRIRSLKLVHASQLEQFIAAEGFFGVQRMPPPSPGWALVQPKRKLVRFPDPHSLLGGHPSVQPVATVPAVAPPRTWVEPFHMEALRDFVSGESCGYVVDRDHVVGFQSHGIERVPNGPNVPTRQQNPYWYTQRVELVSMLKHSEPGVYVSEYLPSMDELREAPIRPLDDFERRALLQLAQEGDIVVEPVGPHVRMLGAIRAAKQCLVCHDVPHGTLLGAFSYELLYEAPRSFELTGVVPQDAGESEIDVAWPNAVRLGTGRIERGTSGTDGRPTGSP